MGKSGSLISISCHTDPGERANYFCYDNFFNYLLISIVSSMELRRAADALLRSQSSSLAAFLTPSTASRWQAGRQLQVQLGYRLRNAPATTGSRTISTTSRYLDPRHRIATGGNSKEESSIDDVAKSLGWIKRGRARTTEQPSSSTQSTPIDNEYEEVIPEPVTSSSTSNSSSLTPEEERRMNGGTSADEILQALYNTTTRPSSTSTSTFDVSKMMDPLSSRSEGYDVMRDINSSLNKSMAQITRPPMRLTPQTGRTVQVGGNVDVGKGFRMLEVSCARNRVRQDFARQRFHERPGLKRKRLKSERWRKRFMMGFKATVARVKQLKKQGW
ncbi:hypothetical protein F5884DRAFT_430908 [Xylogone sp. PMI_703]|nr:hypothetical protein F5884DRAFT_430908 [Xylogone sp. PMI_703]